MNQPGLAAASLSHAMPTQNPHPVSVMLLGGHRLLRAGLRALVERQPGCRVVCESDDPREAVSAAAREAPELVLLDLDAPGQDAFDLLARVVEAAPTARVLVLACERDAEGHRRAARLGARGVVFKQCGSEVLFKAFERVRAGELWFNRSLLGALLSLHFAGPAAADSEAAKIETLTRRERALIALICEGLKNKEIAARLFISHITVRHHLMRIFDKLGVSTRLELSAYAHRHGLAAPPPPPKD